MKKSKIKYEELLSYDDICLAYKHVKSKTKHKKKLNTYEMFYSSNLMNLYNKLKNHEYHHSNYNIFLIKDPKYRIIMSERIDDRIINHLVTNKILLPAIDNRLIDSNCATRKDRGNSYAFKLCKKYINKLKRDYKEFYILKFDITKYFYNIDHSILISFLSEITEDKRIIVLLEEIISSTDKEYVNFMINKVVSNEIDRLSKKNSKEAKTRIEELKKIPLYQKGKGLAIGNLISQTLAVFYLNKIDHFIKEELGCKHYCRYMDGGIILDSDNNKLKNIKNKLEEKLHEIGLKLNKKTNIYKITSGFTFVGYRFFLKNNRLIIRITNVSKKRIKKKYKNLKIYNEEKLVHVMASYKGYLMIASTKFLNYKLVNMLIKKY